MKGMKLDSAATSLKMDRRTACSLIAGSAATALPILGGRASATAPFGEAMEIRYVLSDKRYLESLQFAEILTRHGAIALEVTDGMTSLWREALVPLWHGGSGAVAGLTRRETWTCVAEQARSHARKSIFAGRHMLSVDGRVAEHYLTGTPSMIADSTMLEKSGRTWPLVVADLAMRGLAKGPLADRVIKGSATTEASVPPAFLTSWVVA